jgi:hypothetical protein
MTRLFNVAALVVLSLPACLSRAADSAEPAARTPAEIGGKTPTEKDPESQVETLVRFAMPGPEHRLLDRMAGNWKTVTRYWMAAGVEPVESDGTSQRKWVLDGRFLMEEFDGGNLALPFRGLGLFGYDNFEKKYTSAWVDTMNTSILTNLGDYDKAGDLVNFIGQYKDPWTGIRKKERGITRFTSKDRHRLEIHITEPDGKEFKMLEITYTRVTGFQN